MQPAFKDAKELHGVPLCDSSGGIRYHGANITMKDTNDRHVAVINCDP